MARYTCRECDEVVYINKPLNVNERHRKCGKLMFPDWNYVDEYTRKNDDDGSPS